ncbi:anaerobic ribonucleoside-triphosphate reductase activating protein [Pleomorphomonas diazotrophica]|uniref:Anaerobic ribonucleoside-triphosphate reductase activating protein n=1 Tax=Pleomorphomonas diazotrophica TaxID=1166257 RepID=A0A1I4VSE1_9HYPH|nr:anaerobic ribonucleoside-triphosphate reductase activating protein [Pleomorphomonas diazotrophica]PKR89335.1 anaerobic ribonucleoside-triphosphate reductase activating protein [Pleomorphomonas diazotrophica]SFN04017.1 pyruvate formate lyase activating enzyme [Pleomorphomonas diazotrophica]
MPIADIAVGGFSPLSTCDWPGELVATVFCQGCPFACRYCHNADLIPPGPGTGPSWPEILSILERRRGLLDGVVFSGGEPTLQKALPEAVATVRALGFRVGLHTAGPYPERLARLLPDLDWVGFDVKAPFADYQRITGVPKSGLRARESLVELVGSGVAFEVRTTVHPSLLDAMDLARLDADLAALGVGPTRRQPFRSRGCQDATLLTA